MAAPDLPTVAVVIPVHNGAHYLAETLQAVAAQTHPHTDIVVVDDGSTDDSEAVALATGLPLRWLRIPIARGVSHARNTGLAASTAPFVCFLDQDDVWNPRHLATQLACFAAHPVTGAVVSPYQHWYAGAQGHPSAGSLWPAETGDATDPAFSGWVYHQFLLDCWALTSATMMRREVLISVGAFDTTLPFSEDWDLWLRLSRGVQFAKLAWPPVLYRQHPEQGTRTVRERDWRSELLLRNAETYGMASRDGRCVPGSVFNRTLAGYQLEFGCLHIERGALCTGFGAIAAALQRYPHHSYRAAKASLAAIKRRLARNAFKRKSHVPLSSPRATKGP